MKTARNRLDLLVWLPLVLFLLSFSGGEQELSHDSCSIQNRSFTAGESIVYKVYYNLNFIWIPAGEVEFAVRDEGSSYHLSAHGKTYGSYDWFFKVRDYYDTYIDKGTLLPTLSIRDVQEGKYTLYDKVTFDQGKHTAYGIRGRAVDRIKEQNHFEVQECMHDILSILYYARNIEYNHLPAGATVPIKIFMDKEVWPLQVAYKGKEVNKRIKGLGRFNTILFSPEVITGEYFNEGTEMNVWVSDDANRIPLLIESPVSVGSIKAVLKEYKGLRHPLSSALD